MKVALMLTGLARKVEEGYKHYWKYIIDNHDVDLYLHCWEDEEYEKVEEVYPNAKYMYIQKPFKFTKYREGIESPNDDKSRPLKEYDVWGNFRTFPMFYSWEETFNALRVSRHKYDCVIRSRYDLGTDINIDLNKLDMSKINISNHHWAGSPITDDNLCILNQENAHILFEDIFTEYIEHSKEIGYIEFAEKNFMNILKRKNLYDLVHKSDDLPFQLLRDNKLWY
tara:strand:+ start:489 stop:1163 length:675 start_codon:yes stop_codon:yes gene_type:complete